MSALVVAKSMSAQWAAFECYVVATINASPIERCQFPLRTAMDLQIT